MATKRTGSRRSAAGDVWNRVRDLACNLHWTWNHDTQRLFAALEPRTWEATNRDPLRTLATMRPERRLHLEQDRDFLALLQQCEKNLRDYLKARPWFARTAKGRNRRLLVAYFCSEYAIHESLPQYSGGLGVLAGDHIKSTSDLGIPLVGIGRLYRQGYFQQALGPNGEQIALYPHYQYDQMPLEDTRRTVDVPLAGRSVQCKIWKMTVGRTSVYLLDADHKGNRPADRELTARLYGGDAEYRIQQQVLLGVGGNRALDVLGLKPTVYHMNEGHAAFAALDRLRKLRAGRKSYEKAVEIIRNSSVFTTHTPVPAGHDRYEPRLVTRYLKQVAEGIGLSTEDLLALGRENAGDRKEWFCMTVLALRLSKRCNGVARLHGDTSRRMWQHLYKTRSHKSVPIGHVTNGVHSQTWLAPELHELYRRYLRPRWVGAGPEHDPWARAGKIPPEAFWHARCLLRKRMVGFIRQQLRDQILARSGPLEDLVAACETFDENALTIGFARRFATYKRAPLIFRQARRIAAILNDPDRPVQLVFSGKAHPADKPGQAFVAEVYRQAHAAGLRGRVVLVENYDMHIGRMLTSGCDVWLNNPLRPNEASGTSGMKPPLHGGLNCSISDGWWPEGYNRRNGWVIGDGRELKTPAAQDRYDAEQIYELLENEIVPKFYQRNRQGIPVRWVRMMAESMRSVCREFSSHRMLGDYVRDYYLPAHNDK